MSRCAHSDGVHSRSGARRCAGAPAAGGRRRDRRTAQILRENLDLRIVRRQPGTDRDAKARIVPPLGVEARPRGYDPLTLVSRRRHRPQGERKMCVGQIFQQQVLVVRVFTPDGVKAARDQSRRHRGSNLRVKRDSLQPELQRAPARSGSPVFRMSDARVCCAAPS